MSDYRIPAVQVAAVAGLSLVACSLVLSGSLVRVKSGREVIRVTGSAHRALHSNFIIWDGTITEHGKTLARAYAAIAYHAMRIRAYLNAHGVPRGDIFPLAITTTTHRASHRVADQQWAAEDATGPVVDYELSEPIEVRSRAVDLVDDLARRTTEMLRFGIPIQSGKPQYIYSDLSRVKLQMLSAASSDARDRAERIAQAAGSRLGALRYARMGVMQIEGLYDSEGVEDTGANDTVSLDKKVTAVVTASFSIR